MAWNNEQKAFKQCNANDRWWKWKLKEREIIWEGWFFWLMNDRTEQNR